MTANGRGQRARIVGWGLLGCLLTLPAVAMRFTTEVDWTPLDFVAMFVLLGVLGAGVELAVRVSASGWYRGAAAVALIAAFLLVWVNLAVGIIGAEDDPANAMFAGVLAVAVGGACLARFGAAGMVRAMLATAVAQTVVAAVAVVGDFGMGGPIWPKDVIGATVLFDGLWLTAAAMFGRAAR